MALSSSRIVQLELEEEEAEAAYAAAEKGKKAAEAALAATAEGKLNASQKWEIATRAKVDATNKMKTNIDRWKAATDLVTSATPALKEAMADLEDAVTQRLDDVSALDMATRMEVAAKFKFDGALNYNRAARYALESAQSKVLQAEMNREGVKNRLAAAKMKAECEGSLQYHKKDCRISV